MQSDEVFNSHMATPRQQGTCSFDLHHYPPLSEKAPKEKAEFNLIIHCEKQRQCL